jgi:serine/threonine-protein kinase
MPLRIGETFVDYRILRLLGSGGMGEVYLVQHPRLPRHDALKVLRPDVCIDTSFRERFIREADLAAGLRHPHIVGIHDRGEHDGQLWIAMDYIDGTDAAQLMQQRYPAGMPAELAIPIITAVASALDYAHKKGLLHRDVKPANIIVADSDSDDRRTFLADFGIARSLDDTSGITTTNMTVGTVAYAAPEQLMGEHLDGRADQYALAATAYHLLSGGQVFPHSNPAVVISRHLNTTPPTLGDRRPDCAYFDDVLQTALAKEPEDRFPSCEAFARALVDESPRREAASASATTQAAPHARRSAHTSEERSPAKPATRSRRAWVVTGSVAAIILVIGVIALAWRPWDSQQSNSASTTSTTGATPTNAPTPMPPTQAAPSLAPPASTPLPTNDPALTGPAEGSDCAHAQVNVVTTSSSGTPIRCTSGPGGYSWQPDSGTDSPDPALIGQMGWNKCIKQFPQAKCVASAAAIVNSPNTSGPVFPEGTYDVPSTMPFGTYAAIPWPRGGCTFYIYDSTGKLYDSRTYTNLFDKPVVEVNPFASNGRFQTVGCSPWVMIKPLSPDW